MKTLLLAIDIGNVCIHIDHKNFYRQLDIPETTYGIKELIRDFEWGIIRDEDVFFDRLSTLLSGKFPHKKLQDAFAAILIRPVDGMSDLVSHLPAMGINAAFFSDISPFHLRCTQKMFPAFDSISRGAFSFNCGAWKPSEKMFSHFEELFGTPDLYTDDRSDLISGAKKHGWHAEQFVSAEDLYKKLTLLC